MGDAVSEVDVEVSEVTGMIEDAKAAEISTVLLSLVMLWSRRNAARLVHKEMLCDLQDKLR